MLPLMSDAYNLARWLVQNDEDARDMVQEAYLRAFKFFQKFTAAHDRFGYAVGLDAINVHLIRTNHRIDMDQAMVRAMTQ